jgi:hypothetical protein
MMARVICTPGHSKCSLSLLCEEEGILFTGDAIPQADDLPIYDNAARVVESIRRLKQIKGVKALLSSWRKPSLDEDRAALPKRRSCFTDAFSRARCDCFINAFRVCIRPLDYLGFPFVVIECEYLRTEFHAGLAPEAFVLIDDHLISHVFHP